MTTYALNNLWNYLQGLSLSQSDREWLADKLIMPDKVQEDTAKDDSLTEFLKMEGTWSDVSRWKGHGLTMLRARSITR